jgi:hypothetical protein
MMPQLRLEGQRFGRWIVVDSAGQDEHGHYWWNCVCDCGTLAKIRTGPLRQGKSKSCGCYREDHKGEQNKTHCMTGTPEYKAWGSINERCFNPNHKAYPRYGGRGITVCERWRGDLGVVNFYADIGARPSDAHSVDRFPDNDGNYEPGNVRWATRDQQQNNRRNTLLVSYQGETKPLSAWAKQFGVPRSKLYDRLQVRSAIEVFGWAAAQGSSCG